MTINKVLAKYFGEDNSYVSFKSDDGAGVCFHRKSYGVIELYIYDYSNIAIWSKEFTNPEDLNSFLNLLLNKD